jgi:hypothetical protein
MQKLLIGLLAIGTLSAQASMFEVNGPLDETLFKAQIDDEKTYFETLGDLYKAGQRPNLKKISNIAWAGRCFLKNEQNKPTNAGYIFRKKRSDAGPIALKAYEAFSYWDLNKAPNYFDKMDVEQVFASVTGLEARDGKVKTDSIEIVISTSEKSRLKVSGSYLVEELSALKEDAGPIGKASVFARCYYFIPDLNL